jgi:signal peptidase
MSQSKPKQPDSKDQASTQTGCAASCSFFNLFSDVAQIVLIILLVAVAVVGFGARIPFLAKQGLQFYAVTSGSMEPAIPTGSLIKVGKYKLDDLQQGDVITFTVPSDKPQPQIVTHRIQQVEKEEELVATDSATANQDQPPKKIVSYQFTTQGDANNKPDDYQVKPGDILGKYQWHLPYLGYISAFTQTATGFIILVVVPAIVLIVWEVVSLVMHFKQQAMADNQAEIERLKQQLADKDKGKDKDEAAET